MKLRIKGNTLRLRLTQTEVEEIGKGNTIRETVPFGDGFPSLSYSIEATTDLNHIAVNHENHQIRVSLPARQAQQWATSDTVGIEQTLVFENGDSLYLLIEKDFQCLHKHPEEADAATNASDYFPNPRQ